MKNLTKILFVTALSLCMAFFVNAQTSMDYNILIEDIEFQPGVTIDINVNVYVNENAASWSNQGKIFGVEGMAHTANCLKPFAEKLFEEMASDPSMKKVGKLIFSNGLNVGVELLQGLTN